MWPGETILKLDEDVLLVSRPEDWELGPTELKVPGVTVNNFTSRFFLRQLDPELAELAPSHPWLWHRPHPITGEDTRLRAMGALFGADPRELVKLCEEHGSVSRLGRDDWGPEGLMDVSDIDERRGISCTVMAFRSDDYLAMMGEGPGVDEVLFAEAVYGGRATYLVDTTIFCHHVNYYSLRAEVRALGESVECWNRGAIVAAPIGAAPRCRRHAATGHRGVVAPGLPRRDRGSRGRPSARSCAPGRTPGHRGGPAAASTGRRRAAPAPP